MDDEQNSRHMDAFEAFAEEAEEELGDSLKKLVLYGSVARGEEREESDVDVLAVVERGADKERIYDLSAEVGRRFGVHIAVVARTEEEYDETRETFFTREVMASGRAVI